MQTFVQKKIKTLTDFERNQVIDLFKIHFPNKNPSKIFSLTKGGADFDIVLLKREIDVMGISYYKTHKIKTPFSKGKTPVIHFGIALKNRLYSGNIIWKMGQWYAKKNISFIYPLKKIVGVSPIVSPRVLENFIKLFPNNIFNFPVTKKEEILQFANQYMEQFEGRNQIIDIYYTQDNPEKICKLTDITDDWNRYYKARNQKINDYFVANGVIEFKKDRIFRTSKTIIALGYRSLSDNFKRNKKTIIPQSL